MPQGFYELLGLSASASPADVDAAYQKQLASLVRRVRHARQQGADVHILESQERTLREAAAVLSDVVRRRRYDALRAASDRGLPADTEDLWASAAQALVSSTTVAALRVVRTLTDLPVGDPFPGVADPAVALRLPRPPMATVSPADPSDAGLASSARTDEAQRADGGLADGDDSAVVPVLGHAPVQFDPLEELLADLSGTDAGISLDQTPVDPLDRLARDFGYDGRFLRAVREQRNLKLDDLSRATRISNRYLEAIESNAYDQLPAATFVRGYVKLLVSVLELSDRDVVGGYMALFQRQRG
ncbi:MAG: helix-turn-helix domain-containing protein [Oligoflexia bacterium]|nr:helix-turn-helix domain-containing protein [Oligoflexia bacterium]